MIESEQPRLNGHAGGEQESHITRDPKHDLTCRRFGILLAFLFVFSILPLTIACVFGAILALSEGQSFQVGFLYVASNILNLANPLTEFTPVKPLSIVIDVYVTIIALLLLGLVLNIVHTFQIPTAIDRLVKRCVSNHFVVHAIVIAFIIPLFLVFLSSIFGSLLAFLEGWKVVDGIYYILSNLLGLATPLTDVLPTTYGGDIIDIIVSSFAYGSVAIFLDYVTKLDPVRYLKTRTTVALRRYGLRDLNGNSRFKSLGRMFSTRRAPDSIRHQQSTMSKNQIMEGMIARPTAELDEDDSPDHEDEEEKSHPAPDSLQAGDDMV